MEKANEKLENLKELLKSYGGVAVAYSSGVDSTFLLKVASEVLGEKAIAVTGISCVFPQRESVEAKEFCIENNIKQVIVPINEIELDEFRHNPPNRCYICKKGIFGKVIAAAKEHGIDVVVDGSNKDDEGDYRPGMQALKELGIKSPLRELGFTKEEIRKLSREYNLPTWSKPAYACLSSRFPYGEEITEEKLKMVELAEDYLMNHGFEQMRVRIHGKIARIELLPQDINRMLDETFREEVYKELQSYGFEYVSLDLKGYRMGSMNETIKK